MSASSAPAVVRGMRWSIKISFLAYVGKMPDGEMSVTDGAIETSQGFIFPVADASGFDAETGSGELHFKGDVRLRAHGGMLAVRFANPTVSVTEQGAQLTVLDVSGERLPIARLGQPRSAEGGGIEIPATLRAEAVSYFNDVYAEGTDLDPITIRGV